MTPLLSAAEASATDRRWIDGGVPGLVLMENAGRGAAEVLRAAFADRLARPVVVGGPGQNGGDAWVVARRLATWGLRPRTLIASDPGRVAGDARVNLDALAGLGLSPARLAEGGLDPLRDALADATVVVDGLFGTGLDRPVEGWRRTVLEAMERAAAPVLALDLPSGVDADTGRVLGVAVRAEVTATFGGSKRGLWQHPGWLHGGRVVEVDIGVPLPAQTSQAAAGAWRLGVDDLLRWVPGRPPDAHKGTAGHVLVLAGSPGTTGAAVLSGLGALRGGAGKATLAVRPPRRAALDAKVLELMTTEIATPAAALAALAERDAGVVGPGLGLDRASRELALACASDATVPLVLDADALTAVADVGLDTLRQAAAARVLLPHPGEAARLLGSRTSDVQADRYGAAEELARRSGQVVVLKGAGSIVATTTEEGACLAVCPFGTPALGVAGTGDVLAGVVGARLANGAPIFAATASAVVLHALAGEEAARADRGLLASEVADALPDALDRARREPPRPSPPG